MITIADVDLTKEILVKEFDSFSDRGMAVSMVSIYVDSIIIVTCCGLGGCNTGRHVPQGFTEHSQSMKCVACLAWVLILLYSLVAGLFLYISRSHESPVYWTLDNLVEWYVHEGDNNSTEKGGSFAPLDPPLDPPLFWSPELGIGGESQYSRLGMSLLEQTTKLPAYEPLSTECSS